jgi:nicotinate-nucleotide pyrophosphorylase (carboxylating)
MRLGDTPEVRELIALARREDLGSGDITSALLETTATPARFQLLAKASGVFAGREIAPPILAAFDPAIRIEWIPAIVDGARLSTPRTELASIRGPLASILSAERTLLNFLQRLCGIASLTRAFVDAVAGTQAAIYDTRKTVPGWRLLDKYAVRCGGGRNHRMGLYDAVLLKDNHLAGFDPRRLAATVFEMLNRLPAGQGEAPAEPTEPRASARADSPPAEPQVEIEVSSLEQFEQLLNVVAVDVILLDNFHTAQLRQAVQLRDARGLRGKIELEASGGVTLHNVRDIAAAGVERISVGAITHSVPALDLSLERT